MTRPGGVTASAVVSLIGSAFTLVMAGLLVSAVFLTKTQVPQEPQVRGFAIGAAVVAAALSGLGIWTAIGLFRLKGWARISILVFAGIMAAMSLLSGLVLTFAPIPAPPELPPGTAATMRWVLVAVYAVPFLIGVWWLVLFNQQTTKDAFAGQSGPWHSTRPLSVSIIGWMNLIGGIVSLGSALTGMPAFLAGVVLQGWSARLVYLGFGAIAAYLGWGLLKLHERARLLTLGWFALGAAHAAYMALSPNARARMREFETTLRPDRLPQQSGFDGTTFTMVMMMFSLVLAAVAVWFLQRNKPAFQREPAR